MLYRLRIFDTDGVTPDVTVTTDSLASVPTIPGPIARTLEGKVEQQGWSVSMLSTAIEGDIADADGRPDLGGRLADWSEDPEDGTGFEVVWTGRCTGYDSPDLSTFNARLDSEHWRARRSTIFTEGNTSQLFPPGPSANWAGSHGAKAAGTRAMRVAEVDGPDALLLEWDKGGSLLDKGVEFLNGDVKRDVTNGQVDRGNFTHARLEINGTDREVISFTAQRGRHPTDRLRADADGGVAAGPIWVYWPSHGQTAGSGLGSGGASFPCRLHAPTAPPSEALPLHIGGTDAIDVATFVQDIYDGDYGAEDELAGATSVRADTSALVGQTRAPFRITEPANMAKWLEENIYRPLLWCPFVDADGEIAPRSVALPQDIAFDALTVLDSDNAEFPFPEWDYDTRDAITSLLVEQVLWVVSSTQTGSDRDGDLVSELVTKLPARDHDNISRLGRRAVTFRRQAGMGNADFLEREVFERVGDGMIQIPAIHVDSGITGCDAGDFVELDHDTLKLPNLNTNDRTGASIWQVVKRDRLDTGAARLQLEYAGPSSQKLDPPTVSVAQNSDDPENSVDVTISGLSSGEGYLLWVNRGDGYARESGGITNETVTVGECPSGTTINVRAVRTKEHRIRSAFATDSVATATITAPSSLTVTPSGTEAVASWTVGDSDYPLELLLDGERVIELPVGTSTHTLRGLTASTTYNSPGLAVRHVDEFGGTSSSATDDFTTGSITAAPDMVGIDVEAVLRRVGGLIFTAGARVYLYPGDTGFDIEVQGAPDSSGSPGTYEIVAIVSGDTPFAFERRGFDGSTRWYRARHVRAGYSDGSFTDAESVDFTDPDDTPPEGPVRRDTATYEGDIPTRVRDTTNDRDVEGPQIYDKGEDDAGDIARSSGSAVAVDAVITNITDGGHADTGMEESGGKALNLLLAKPLAADPDTADSVSDGVTNRVTTLNEATGGSRGFSALNSSNNLTTGVEPGTRGTMVHDHSNVTQASVTASSETDLMSRTLPTLADGDMVDFVAIGTITSGSATKTVRMRLGGVEIARMTVSTSGSTRWHMRGHLVKDGSTTWVIVIPQGEDIYTSVASAAVDLSGAALKVTGLTNDPGQPVTAEAFVTTATNKQ